MATAIKLTLCSIIVAILTLAFAWIAIVFTDSGSIGLIAAMIGFALSICLIAVVSPIIFKKFNRRWEEKKCQEDEQGEELNNKTIT